MSSNLILIASSPSPASFSGTHFNRFWGTTTHFTVFCTTENCFVSSLHSPEFRLDPAARVTSLRARTPCCRICYRFNILLKRQRCKRTSFGGRRSKGLAVIAAQPYRVRTPPLTISCLFSLLVVYTCYFFLCGSLLFCLSQAVVSTACIVYFLYISIVSRPTSRTPILWDFSLFFSNTILLWHAFKQ